MAVYNDNRDTRAADRESASNVGLILVVVLLIVLVVWAIMYFMTPKAGVPGTTPSSTTSIINTLPTTPSMSGSGSGLIR